jgi:beta-fructofuranosidase
MRSGKVEYHDVQVVDTGSEIVSLDGIKGRKVDMEIQIRPGDEENLYRKFSIRFAQNEQHYTSVSFRPHENVLKIDRKFSGSRRAIIHQRRSKVNSENGILKLRMILDQFSVEVFVNDGEQVMTATMYTENSADGISFFADGNVKMDIVKYELI